MLMATGANFGARSALPHASGIVLGFTFMIIAIGLGVAQLFQSYPLAHQLLGGISVIYLVYLAYKTATASTSLDSPEPHGQAHYILASRGVSMGEPQSLDHGPGRGDGLCPAACDP